MRNPVQCKKIIAIVFLLLYFICFWMLGTSLYILDDFSWGRVLAVSFLFSIFFVSIFSWGELLQNIVHPKERHVLLNLGYGSAAASLFAYFLGVAGGVGGKFDFLFHLFVIFPFFFFPYLNFTSENLLKRDKLKNDAQVILFLLLLFVLYKFIVAAGFLNYFVTDSLYYHLVAPKLWHDLGAIQYIENYNLIYLSGFWEFFYIFPFSLFSTHGAHGLVEAQLFAQQMHWGIGYVGSLGVAFLLSSLFFKRLSFRLFSVLCFTLVLDGHWTALSAKNDWGIQLWLLTGISTLLLKEKRSWLSFFFLSLAVVSKFTVVLSLFPVWLAAIFFGQKKQGWLWWIKACTVSVLPMTWFAVKWIQVGNPLYPALLGVFKNSLMSEELKYFFITSQQRFFSLGIFVRRLWETFLNAPLYILVFIFPWWQNRSFQKKYLVLFSIFGFSYLLMLFAYSPLLDQRHFLFMYGPLAILITLQLEMILGTWVYRRAALIATSICVFIFSLHYVISEAYFYYHFWATPNRVLVSPDNYSSFLMWLREKYRNEKIAFSLSIDTLYYVSDLPYYTIRQDIKTSDKIEQFNCTYDIVEALINNGYNYYYEPRTEIPLSRSSVYIRERISQCTEAFVFLNKKHFFIDLNKYMKCLSESNVTCREGQLILKKKYFLEEGYDYYTAPTYNKWLKENGYL